MTDNYEWSIYCFNGISCAIPVVFLLSKHIAIHHFICIYHLTTYYPFASLCSRTRPIFLCRFLLLPPFLGPSSHSPPPFHTPGRFSTHLILCYFFRSLLHAKTNVLILKVLLFKSQEYSILVSAFCLFRISHLNRIKWFNGNNGVVNTGNEPLTYSLSNSKIYLFPNNIDMGNASHLIFTCS